MMENQTPEVVVSQRSKSNPMLWVAIGSAILVSGIGIGLVAGKYFQPVSSTTSVSIVPSTPILSPTVVPVEEDDLTANWKTYINEAHNYSLKYPQTWIVNAVDADLDKNSELIIFDNGYKITIWSNLIGIGGLIRKVPYELVTVSGLSLYKRELGDNLVEKTSKIEIADRPDSPTFIHGGKTYDISFDYPSSAKNTNELKSHLEIFNQLLSTFKFLDQNADPEGKFCGGFAGIICPKGYECKYEPNSDGGYCIKN